MTTLIILFGFWTYPILGYYLFALTENRTKIRKKIVITLCFLTFLACFGTITHISTTSSVIDVLIFSTIYLAISLALVSTQFQKKKALKVLGTIIMILFFGFGYLISTIGFLAVSVVASENETVYEKWLGSGLIYKEINLGNTFPMSDTDHTYKKVEIYKTNPWFPIIEWRIQTKTYDEYICSIPTPMDVKFETHLNRIYLSAKMWCKSDHKNISLTDTLIIKN